MLCVIVPALPALRTQLARRARPASRTPLVVRRRRRSPRRQRDLCSRSHLHHTDQWTFAVNTESTTTGGTSSGRCSQRQCLEADAVWLATGQPGRRRTLLGDSPDSGAEGFGLRSRSRCVSAVINSKYWRCPHEFDAPQAVHARDAGCRRGAGGTGHRAHPVDARLARFVVLGGGYADLKSKPSPATTSSTSASRH